MSLELNKLKRLVDAKDLHGICDWVDEVVEDAKRDAVEERDGNMAQVCGQPLERLSKTDVQQNSTFDPPECWSHTQ